MYLRHAVPYLCQRNRSSINDNVFMSKKRLQTHEYWHFSAIYGQKHLVV